MTRLKIISDMRSYNIKVKVFHLARVWSHQNKYYVRISLHFEGIFHLPFPPLWTFDMVEVLTISRIALAC